MQRDMHPKLAAVCCLWMVSLLSLASAGRLLPLHPQRNLLTASSNALVPQGLAMNGLTQNALTTNGLAMNSLSVNSIQALLDVTQASDVGHMGRMLVKYLARCAFNSSQSLSVTYTTTGNDGDALLVTETYTGVMGLAPSWASGPLNDVNSQEWVTACLIAHVNYYGKSVMISVRGAPSALKKATTGTELASYKTEEGAFWGNVFSNTPSLYACYNEANVEYARSLFRECAAGHVMLDGSVGSCSPIQRVGPCDQVCDNNKGKGQYRTDCHGPGGAVVTGAVVTVYLP